MLHTQTGKFNLQINHSELNQNLKNYDSIQTPFVLKIKNREISDDSKIYEFDQRIPPITIHHTEQITTQLMQKQREIENKSLKQQNDYLVRELELKQKEIETLLQFCQTNRPYQKRLNHKDIELYDQYSAPTSQNQNYSYNGNIEARRAYSYDQQDSYRMDNSSDHNSNKRIKRAKIKNQLQSREHKEVRFSENESSYEKLPSIRRSIPNSSQIITHRTKKRKQYAYFPRIKIIFLFILATIRWSKNFRLKRKQKLQLLKKVQQKYDQSLETLAQQDIFICKSIIKQWIQQIIAPIISFFSSSQFQQEAAAHQKEPNSEQAITMRQIFFLQLSRRLLNDMEQFTQKNQIPLLIQTSFYLSLFRSQNSSAPLFVAKRTNFYTKNTIKIGNYQEKMILSEYFIFRLFSSHLIEQTNCLTYQNLNHKMQSKFLLLAFLGILQILFLDYFSEIKQVQQITTEVFQRRIKVTKTQDISIITDKNIDREESLIFGLHSRENFEDLFNNNQDWLKDICTKFGKIVNNLHNIIV